MRFILTGLFLAITFLALPARAAEYYGEFLDQLKGIFVSHAKPRPTFMLESEFRFRDPNGLVWVTPAKEEVDGASIPQEFWTFIGGPFEGKYLNASVIHDHYCKTKKRTAHDTHRAFYYGMRTAEVPEWQAKFMYWAVSLFGPDWELVKRASSEPICLMVNNKTICHSSITISEVAVDKKSVDLADPLVLAMALSKAESVARTLKTTNGKALDITSDGQVSASLDNISSNSKNYKVALSTASLIKDPQRLGVLAEWQNKPLDDVIPWANNITPAIGTVITLGIRKPQPIGIGRGFMVNKYGTSKVITQVQNKGAANSALKK